MCIVQACKVKNGMREYQNMSSFSRTVANEQKKGAYYTDQGMCRRIGRLLALPADDEVSVLEPAIGNAKAVQTVLDNVSVKAKKTAVFGVELDEAVAKETREELKKLSEDNVVIQADFLSGTKISYNTFSLCFSNPPYRKADTLNDTSLETQFMKSIYPLMKKQGILVYVIPYYTLINQSDFLKPFLLRFEPVACYRFDDKEYEQFQQCVLVGRRRLKLASWENEGMVEMREAFLESIKKKELLPYLPGLDEEVKEPIMVPASKPADVKEFTTRFFDYAKAGETLSFSSPLYKEQSRRLNDGLYRQSTLNSPPVPLKKDLLYLCAISGGGQGYCGSEEEGNLHLQRGVVKTIKEDELTTNDKGDSIIVEHTRSAISMTVLENNGTFHLLK